MLPMASVAARDVQLVGRERELEQLRRFHGMRADGSAALLIGGEPGSGRTALLEAATAGDEFLVLRARPQPEETSQPFAALRDLLGSSDATVSEGLTPPLRDALATALLLRQSDATTEPGLVYPAFAATLELLARERSVLIAIDDVDSLDPDSIRALRFAINRLPAGVSLVIVHPTHVDPILALAIDRSVPTSRRVRIIAAPLSAAATRQLLVQTLGPVSRSTVSSVARASGGNVRASLELGRVALEGGELDGEIRSVPDSVAALVERRLGRLSPDAQRVTQLVAVAGRLSVLDLEAVVSMPHSALQESEAAGAVVEEGGVLRTSGALVTTVVLGQSTPAAIRSAHSRVATVAASPDDQARHLVFLPDAAQHVGTIEAGAEFALGRGAAAAAAELFSAAVRLTPADLTVDRARRLRGEALARLAAGDPAAARESAEAAIATAPDADRPRLVADLADLAWADGTIKLEARRIRDALELTADTRLQLDLMTALVSFGVANDPVSALADADAALRLGGDDDPGRLGYVGIHREMASALAGHGVDWDRLRESIHLEEQGAALGRGPSSPPLVLFTMCDRAEEARARFAVEDGWYAARGEDGWRAERAGQLALVELRAGNTALARYLADDACDRLDRLQVGGGWPLVYAWRSLVDAHMDRAPRALVTVGALLNDVDDATLWAGILRSVAVFASNAVGDDAATLEHAARMRETLEPLGVTDLLADRSEPLLAELRASAGDIPGAESELDRLERRHAALPRPWTAAALTRTRAIVLAGQGRLDEALARASDPAGEDPALPFETGWNRLSRGRLLRRVRDKQRAAVVLRSARAVFETLGATRWASQAAAELERVGLRHRPADQLTEGELTIARLAGQGLTTRQIADAAFVSPKTVEANLTRAYRKLGIRSRAELGAWVQQREGGAKT
jgi:DNA-binding CsgD family transcriptional regulator